MQLANFLCSLQNKNITVHCRALHTTVVCSMHPAVMLDYNNIYAATSPELEGIMDVGSRGVDGRRQDQRVLLLPAKVLRFQKKTPLQVRMYIDLVD